MMAGEMIVEKADAVCEVTVAALEDAAVDVRQLAHDDLRRKLKEVTGDARWLGEPTFIEKETFRTVGVYANDANWDDDDNPPEPIGYEDIPVVLIRAMVPFMRSR